MREDAALDLDELEQLLQLSEPELEDESEQPEHEWSEVTLAASSSLLDLRCEQNETKKKYRGARLETDGTEFFIFLLSDVAARETNYVRESPK